MVSVPKGVSNHDTLFELSPFDTILPKRKITQDDKRSCHSECSAISGTYRTMTREHALHLLSPFDTLEQVLATLGDKRSWNFKSFPQRVMESSPKGRIEP